MMVGVLLSIGLVVIPFFRQAVGVSAYEYFGKRLGYGGGPTARWGFSLGHFSKIGFVFYLVLSKNSSFRLEFSRIQLTAQGLRLAAAEILAR